MLFDVHGITEFHKLSRVKSTLWTLGFSSAYYLRESESKSPGCWSVPSADTLTSDTHGLFHWSNRINNHVAACDSQLLYIDCVGFISTYLFEAVRQSSVEPHQEVLEKIDCCWTRSQRVDRKTHVQMLCLWALAQSSSAHLVVTFGSKHPRGCFETLHFCIPQYCILCKAYKGNKLKRAGWLLSHSWKRKAVLCSEITFRKSDLVVKTC